MLYKIFIVLLFCAFARIRCEDGNATWLSLDEFNVTLDGEPSSTPSVLHEGNKRNVKKYVPIILSCAASFDVPCLVDNAEDYLENVRLGLLAEADEAVTKVKGRSVEESPSELGSMIGNLVSEMTDIVKSSITGFFRSGKDVNGTEEEDDYDDEDSDDGDEGEEDDKKPKSDVQETRGKKKKGKLIALIKLVVIGIVLYAKLILLLKFLALKLQLKFLLVALGNLLLHALKLWWEFKHKKETPQKVIYYEHAQHQHHYDGGAEDWESSGPPSGSGGYWARSYEDNTGAALTAHDLAYAKQKPVNHGDKKTSWF